MQNLMPPVDTSDNAFHDGDPTTGQLGTIVNAEWLNNVQGATRDTQAEIIAVLTKAGMQPNPQKKNQLAEAIGLIIGSGDYVTNSFLKLELLKKLNTSDVSQTLGNDLTKVPSLDLITRELGKKASTTDVNGKLAKDQNGADIPDKPKFIENLGLGEAAKSGLKQTTGTSKTDVMSQDGVTKAFAKYLELTGGTLTGSLVITQDGPAIVVRPTTENGSCYVQGRDSKNKAVWFIGNPTDGGAVIYLRNYLTNSEISLHKDGVSINRDAFISGMVSPSDYSNFDARYSKIRTVQKSESGYEKDESTGLIRQWGRTTPFAPGNGYPAKFPIPFPTKCLGVGMLLIRSSATTTTSNESIYCGEPGLSGVQLYHGGGETYPAYWEAWGY